MTAICERFLKCRVHKKNKKFCSLELDNPPLFKVRCRGKVYAYRERTFTDLMEIALKMKHLSPIKIGDLDWRKG